jgi:hypothetical protein
VRSRAILLVLVVGGLAAGSQAARVASLGLDQVGPGRLAISTAAVAPGELSDPPALGAVTRARDALDRDGERRINAFAIVGAVALLVVAASWTAVRLRSHDRRTRIQVRTRPRAPPTLPVLVVSS